MLNGIHYSAGSGSIQARYRQMRQASLPELPLSRAHMKKELLPDPRGGVLRFVLCAGTSGD